MATLPFKVKAIYEYTSEHEDDLNFPIGQIINVTELEGDDWYVGQYTDTLGVKKEGLFPTNFVEKYEPEVPVRPSRPSRPKQEATAPASAPQPVTSDGQEDEQEETAPPVPVVSKPQPPPSGGVSVGLKEDEVKPPPSIALQKPTAMSDETTPASQQNTAEPAATTPAKKAPPPIAAKSNAFKDRIAAFNQTAAAPIAPMQPGRQPQPGSFIKKPFVAAPPSKNSYIPPPKPEPVHKPYVREEDPEIKQRQEEDREAAEAVGLTSEGAKTMSSAEDEDAPKPLTLKERMAMLQKQQQEQAQRRADAGHKKEKKPPVKKSSQSSDRALAQEQEEGEDMERVRSDETERASLEASRDRPRISSTQRRPTEPTSPLPVQPEHEILSDGNEADQSAAGEMTEDDTGTLGPDKDESDEPRTQVPRASTVHEKESDDDKEEDAEEDVEEEEVDEETRRKDELRARMARLGGGMPGMGSPFNPFGAPPPTASKRKVPKTVNDEAATTSSSQAPPTQQRIPMIPVPGLQRVQSGGSDTTQRQDSRAEEENDQPHEDAQDPAPAPAPPKRTSTLDRSAPPPVPRGKSPMCPVFPSVVNDCMMAFHSS
jgi:myosin tail region-interacting protein MTI1